MKKIIFGIILTFIGITSLMASSATISVSSNKSTVVVGNTFTVTTKISSKTKIGSWEWTLSYDTSKFKLVTNNAYFFSENGEGKYSKTYTLKAIAKGSGKITVKSYGAFAYNDESKMSVSIGSKTVKVITQSELIDSYSKNNNLSSLSIEGATLSPEFKSSETNYTVTLGANTEKIVVNAKKSDSTATISGAKEYSVTEGENKIEVKVTAQNGDVKTYKIIVTVTDPNPINVTINDEVLTVVKRESLLISPQDYEKTLITINEQSIPALFNELNNYTLVGLKDSQGDVKLYIYNSELNTYTLYDEVNISALKIVPLEIDSSFDSQYLKTNVTIDDIIFNSLSIKNSNYHIIHARNLNIGKDDYYLYDKENNTMIKYTDEDTLIYKEKINKYEMIIMILLAETLFVFIILIIILMKKVRRNKKIKLQKLAMLKENKAKDEVKENKEINETKVKDEDKKVKKEYTKKRTNKKEVTESESKKDN